MSGRLFAALPVLLVALTACSGQGTSQAGTDDLAEPRSQSVLARTAPLSGDKSTAGTPAVWVALFTNATVAGAVPSEQMQCTQGDDLECLLRP